MIGLLVLVMLSACLAGCGRDASSSRAPAGLHGEDRGGLAPAEWVMALGVAVDEQSKVTGTFVGATEHETLLYGEWPDPADG